MIAKKKRLTSRQTDSQAFKGFFSDRRNELNVSGLKSIVIVSSQTTSSAIKIQLHYIYIYIYSGVNVMALCFEMMV